MSLEAAIVDRLNGYAPLTALVGNRIYADVVPKEASEPAIAFQRISTLPIGALNADTEHDTARVQFTIVGGDKLNKIAISDALQGAIRRYTGTHAGTIIKDSKLENEQDLPYDNLTKEVARVLDFFITYE